MLLQEIRPSIRGLLQEETEREQERVQMTVRGDPEISLINCIDNPPNNPSNNMLAIVDSGMNTHLEKYSTTTTAPVIITNEMTSILPYGSTMESSHISTLQLPMLRKQERQIIFSQKFKQPH